ncbi:MAG: META domain-containing protein [Actinomycetota bacterium]|nr:META domain-containing protein [Actinomycetota bacterium]
MENTTAEKGRQVTPEGTWLVEVFMVDGEMVPPLPGSTMSLEFVEGRVGGVASINRFMGQFGDELLFGPLATTMMAGPPQLMEQEGRYLGLLSQADSLLFGPNELSLIAKEDVIVVLKPEGTDSEE